MYSKCFVLFSIGAVSFMRLLNMNDIEQVW